MNKARETYRGWAVYFDPPPIPVREFDWHAVSPNYDASWEGEERGYVDNGQAVYASTREKVILEVDKWLEENAPEILIDRATFLRENGWSETERGWSKTGGFGEPLPLDSAHHIQTMLDELDRPECDSDRNPKGGDEGHTSAPGEA